MKPYLVDYSEKSVALFGDTKPYIEDIKKLRGYYNAYLTNPTTGEKEPGWIFQSVRKEEIQNFIDGLAAPAPPTLVIEETPEETPQPVEFIEPEPTPEEPAPSPTSELVENKKSEKKKSYSLFEGLM